MLQFETLLRSVDFQAPFHVPGIDIDSIETPAEAALTCRSMWGLPCGPIADLYSVLEDAGCIVFCFDFGVPDVDAISMRSPRMPPTMFVNSTMPTDRQRFTVAHELGHLVLHQLPNKTMEAEADDFASEFLMPAADISSHLYHLDLERLAMLKRHWRVSMASILKRAEDLGIISARKAKSLWIELSKLGYRKREPIDIEQPAPKLIADLIRVHTDQLGYSDEEVASSLSLHLHEFRCTHLPSNGPKLCLVR
jgi:Zn-dependent peptidase ImmA (M78 family)